MTGRRWTPSRRGMLAGGVALVAVAVGVAVLVLPRGEVATEPPDPPPTPAPVEQATLPLTGVPVDVVPQRPALIVKISNSAEARPQTGLDRADVVLEELTEGGITRFVAIFHGDLPDVVGPVRSARPVDAQIVGGYGTPGFAFSGARPEVREILARTAVVTLTEGAPGFFRDRGTYASHPFAPHDLFLELAPALDAVTEAGARPLTDVGWTFDVRPPVAGGRTARDLEVVMSRSSTTSWVHDPGQGLYRRQQHGVPSAVTGPGRIGAANVVVLATRRYIGASGYPETDVVGSGAARIARDGRVYEARWSKPTATAPLTLTLADGSGPFPLRPGPTWLHLADDAALPALAP